MAFRLSIPILCGEPSSTDSKRRGPGRLVNKTNGISFRRGLYQANPELTSLLIDVLGERVLDDTEALKELEPLASDCAFVRRFLEMRQRNKLALARCVWDLTGT